MLSKYIEDELQALREKYQADAAYSSYDSGKFDALTDLRNWYNEQLADIAVEIMDEIVQEESQLEKVQEELLTAKKNMGFVYGMLREAYVNSAIHNDLDRMRSALVMSSIVLQQACPEIEELLNAPFFHNDKESGNG